MFACWHVWHDLYESDIHSEGPQYINDNFPLIDKFEKCTVERFPAGGKPKVQAVETLPDPEPEPVKPKSLRALGGGVNDAGGGPVDTDASALVLPENGIVLGAVFLLALILFALFRGGRKNETKTQ